MTDRGLVIVFTGDGKGKSSAALGIALRACGHKMNVSMVQFIKSTTFGTGEAAAAEKLAPEFEFIPMGKGLVTEPNNDRSMAEHKSAAESALDHARQRSRSGSWDILILDEVNNAVKLGLIDIKEVLELIRNKPLKLNIILTGRDAHPRLIEIADMVTEMRSIKHPYDKGFGARQGIDF